MRAVTIEHMIGRSASALVIFGAALFLTLLWPSTPVNAAQVASEEAACSSVKARFAAVHHVGISVIAFCDFIVEDAQPKGFYVLALHSRRDCDGICSTNMGWFAIEKTTGRVFEWNVADWRLGGPI